jgi:hypothetical protein
MDVSAVSFPPHDFTTRWLETARRTLAEQGPTKTLPAAAKPRSPFYRPQGLQLLNSQRKQLNIAAPYCPSRKVFRR